MKKIIYIIMCICLVPCSMAQTYISMRPNWTFNPPPPENSTYEYYVSKGVGNTEKEARTDAFLMAFKEAQARIGVAADSKDIFKSFQSNAETDFNVVASYYNIPMKEVCAFSEPAKDAGKYYHYQLLQIAVSGNIEPQFRQFTGDCYDFSKAKELREIMKEEYKGKIKEDEKKQKKAARYDAQEERRDRLRDAQGDRKARHLSSPYFEKNKHRYATWHLGTGYPWNLFTGTEFRWGGIVGIGAYADFGMDFTELDYTYTLLHWDSNNEEYSEDRTFSGSTLKVLFHFAGGLKFYFYKGFHLDIGYGSIHQPHTEFSYESTAHLIESERDIEARRHFTNYSHGLLFHLGYNLVTSCSDSAGFYLGISGGASYDISNKKLTPSVGIKIGFAIGIKK